MSVHGVAARNEADGSDVSALVCRVLYVWLFSEAFLGFNE